MNEIDFNISRVHWVLQRPANAAWKMDQLYFAQEYMMMIALEGEAVYTIGDQTVSVKKNDILLFSPGIMRSGHANPQKPWSFITVNFNLELGNPSPDFFQQAFLLFPGSGERLRNKFADIAYVWEGKNPLYQLQCRHILTGILLELIHSRLPLNRIPHFKKLESARTYIQANFRHEIDIEALAERLGLSVSYFRKLFKKAYGIAPMQYITDLRINTARDLLLSGEVNVTKAALLSGFHDVYYFSALFKKRTGLPPSQFIQGNH